MDQRTLMKFKLTGVFAALALLLVACRSAPDPAQPTAATGSAKLDVMSSAGFAVAYLELVPEFERASGTKLTTSYGPSIGSAPDAIPSRLQRGEPVDVVVMASPGLGELIKQGKVAADSRVDLARSRIGIAVRAGTPRPDISTVAAFKQALLAARSIAYSDSVSGVYVSTELFERLGIADQVKSKSTQIQSERVGNSVARGEAEIGFQQISELLPVPGIDIVGPIPGELQKITIFSAAVAVSSRDPQAARALIRFLSSPRAISAIARSGLEPIALQPN
jgi:molybdate transport system substrate-binding protein